MTSRNSRRGALYVLDDQTGHDIILHTGMMGGGTRGFTRDVFQDNYVGPVARVQGFENTFAQVADIDGSEPLAEICSFATEARRIKQLIRAEEEAAQSTPRSRTLFTAYETKRLKTRRTPQVEPGEVDLVHDPVTNALDAAIREFGYQPMEDADRGGTHDLLLRKPKSILFEVKTTLGVQDAYTAVGQLLLNGSRLRPSPSLVYVCPAPPLGTRPWYFGAFNRLGIQIVTYTSVDGEPRVNHRQLGRVLPPS